MVLVARYRFHRHRARCMKETRGGYGATQAYGEFKPKAVKLVREPLDLSECT